jgi:hypothetical protein
VRKTGKYYGHSRNKKLPYGIAHGINFNLKIKGD